MIRIVRIAALVGMVAAFGAKAADAPALSAGQTVYVPVYSHILHGNRDSRGDPGLWLLSAMLSIRNTDPATAITVRSVRYYGSDGKLVREYPAEAKTLGPMATAEVFVDHKDVAGGSGANFVVVWEAARPINQPIIETVHANVFGTQSVVFTSPGQALRLDPR